MNVEFSKNFEKQIDYIRDARLKEEIAGIVRLVMKIERLQQIPNIKKLKGFKSAYRIRSGDYRIGIIYQDNSIYFMAFASRKDIYKIFP